MSMEAGHLESAEFSRASAPMRVQPILLRLGVAVAVLVLGFSAASRFGLTTIMPVAALNSHLVTVVLCVLLANLFILLKSAALYLAARYSQVGLSYMAAARLFCESVVVDLATWPGKIWSDCYKYAALEHASGRQRVLTIALFRAAGAGAMVLLLILSVVTIARQPGDGFPMVRVAAIAGLTVLLTVVAVQRCRSAFGNRVRSSFLLVLPAMLATVADVSAVTLLAWQVADAPVAVFAPWYVLVSTTAMISQLPAGAGVLDVGCWLVLTQLCGASAPCATLVIVLYRILGPGYTLIMGISSMACRKLPSKTLI